MSPLTTGNLCIAQQADFWNGELGLKLSTTFFNRMPTFSILPVILTAGKHRDIYSQKQTYKRLTDC